MQWMKRFLFAFLVLWTLSGCQTLQQIDQGLYQVADAVSEEDRVTGQRSLSFAGRSEQIARGNQYVEQMLANEKKEGRKVDAALNKQQYYRLVRVFDRIHTISHLSNERWRPVLIQRDSFNAFTTGGSYIVVHLGLMEQLKRDDELAAVVAHEIAHTVANHVFERQSHAQVSAITGSKSARKGGYQAAFTHESEREADQIGILYAALAGFDPMAASRIWERQFKLQGNARALFAHDHPVNAERQAETAKVGRAVMQYYTAGKRNPQYASLLKNNVLWQQGQSAKAGEGGGLQALLGTAFGAYVQHEQAKREARRQQAHANFVKAIESRMTLENSRALNTTTLHTQWYYREGPRVKQVVVGLLIKKDEKVLRAVAHVDGEIRAGGRFQARFTLPEGVTTRELKSLQGRFYLDDALPAQ